MTAHGTATDVLEAVRAVFAAAGVDLPDRQYAASAAVGSIAWDCAQLVVGVGRIFPGIPGAEFTGQDLAGCRGPRVQSMAVVLLRCVPVPDEEGEPPTSAELDTSAAELLADADLLHDGLIDHLLANGAAWNDVRAWRVGALDAVGPEGGLAGWSLVVEVPV